MQVYDHIHMHLEYKLTSDLSRLDVAEESHHFRTFLVEQILHEESDLIHWQALRDFEHERHAIGGLDKYVENVDAALEVWPLIQQQFDIVLKVGFVR